MQSKTELQLISNEFQALNRIAIESNQCGM